MDHAPRTPHAEALAPMKARSVRLLRLRHLGDAVRLPRFEAPTGKFAIRYALAHRDQHRCPLSCLKDGSYPGKQQSA